MVNPTQTSQTTERRLLLMRHAKSDWDDPQLKDHDRPLNARGRRGADVMAHWIESHGGGVPDLVLCSSATRTRETLDRMLAHWSSATDVRHFESLYHADPEAILRCVRCDGGEALRVLVVGHNPGMEMLAAKLANRYQAFITATVAVFSLPQELNWDQLRLHQQLPLIAFGHPD